MPGRFLLETAESAYSLLWYRVLFFLDLRFTKVSDGILREHTRPLRFQVGCAIFFSNIIFLLVLSKYEIWFGFDTLFAQRARTEAYFIVCFIVISCFEQSYAFML